MKAQVANDWCGRFSIREACRFTQVELLACPGVARWSKCSTNFTLVELLVVISIIMILAGMLMPALNNARERARKITCVSNLRQIGLSLREYSGDFDHTAPPFLYNNHHFSHADYVYIGNRWDGMGLLWLGKYLRSPEIWFCASNKHTNHTDNSSKFVESPVAGTIIMTAYVYRDPSYSYWETSNPATTWDQNHWHASDCALVSDAWGSRENYGAHKDGFNVLYGDGHVTWGPMKETSQIQETENKNTDNSCCNASMTRGWIPIDDLSS